MGEDVGQVGRLLFQASADTCEDVIAALVGWARQDDGWDTGLAWSPLDMGPARAVPPLDLDEEERLTLERRVPESLAGGYIGTAVGR